VVARRRSGHRFAAGRTVGTGDIGSGFDAAIATTGADGQELVLWQDLGPNKPEGSSTTDNLSLLLATTSSRMIKSAAATGRVAFEFEISAGRSPLVEE
jgi:hypothetical protein